MRLPRLIVLAAAATLAVAPPVQASPSSLARALPRPRQVEPAPRAKAPFDEQMLLEVARDIDPALYRRLRTLRDRDQAAFHDAITISGGRLIGLTELRARDEKLYQVKLNELRRDAQIARSAQRVVEAMRSGSGDVAALRAELQRAVLQQTALSMKARVEYLAALQKHIESLRHSIERDVAGFMEQVDERMAELLIEPAAVRDLVPPSDPAALDAAGIGEARMPALTEALVEQVLEVARDLDPQMYQRLCLLHEADPRKFRVALRTAGRRILGLAELKQRDERLYAVKLSELRIDAQVLRAAAQLQAAIEAGSNEVEPLRDELRKHVIEQIALQIKVRVEYLTALQEHIESIEESIDQDATTVLEIVERRTRQALIEAGAPPSATMRRRQ